MVDDAAEMVFRTVSSIFVVLSLAVELDVRFCQRLMAELLAGGCNAIAAFGSCKIQVEMSVSSLPWLEYVLRITGGSRGKVIATTSLTPWQCALPRAPSQPRETGSQTSDWRCSWLSSV